MAVGNTSKVETLIRVRTLSGSMGFTKNSSHDVIYGIDWPQ